jgi:hypothetical protein
MDLDNLITYKLENSIGGNVLKLRRRKSARCDKLRWPLHGKVQIYVVVFSKGSMFRRLGYTITSISEAMHQTKRKLVCKPTRNFRTNRTLSAPVLVSSTRATVLVLLTRATMLVSLTRAAVL